MAGLVGRLLARGGEAEQRQEDGPEGELELVGRLFRQLQHKHRQQQDDS